MKKLQCTESVANEHPEGRHPEICIWILYNFCLLRGLLCLQNFNSFFLPFVSVMCISRNYPYPPPRMATEIPRGWGGPKRGNFRGRGGCYRGLFPGGLSDHEIGELLINNSSVEKAVSYLLLPVFQNKYYNLFALINFYLWSAKYFLQKYSDQFRFLGNCSPTPPLRQHFGLSKKKVLMMA